jgi:hypothetical protein
MQMILKPMRSDAARGDHMEMEAWYLRQISMFDFNGGLDCKLLHSRSSPSRRAR